MTKVGRIKWWLSGSATGETGDAMLLEMSQELGAEPAALLGPEASVTQNGGGAWRRAQRFAVLIVSWALVEFKTGQRLRRARPSSGVPGEVRTFIKPWLLSTGRPSCGEDEAEPLGASTRDADSAK